MNVRWSRMNFKKYCVPFDFLSIMVSLANSNLPLGKLKFPCPNACQAWQTRARDMVTHMAFCGEKIIKLKKTQKKTTQKHIYIQFKMITAIHKLYNIHTNMNVLCYSKVAVLAHLSWKLQWAFLITFCCRLSARKLFTFSTSSQKLLDKFQPNWAQSTLCRRGFIVKNQVSRGDN